MAKLWPFLIFSDFAFNIVNNLFIQFILISMIADEDKVVKEIKQSLEIVLGRLFFLISYFFEGGLLHQQ